MSLFTAPAGAPALVPADSVSWRVFANPITLFIGGVAAVLFELAEPHVRHGVATFSDFTRAPRRRLQRTGLAAMVTVYAPMDTARTLIAGVVRRHAGVRGIAETGRDYSANDPDLLRWVQVTASYGFLEAYRRYVVDVTTQDADRYYAEAATGAALYGVKDGPTDAAGIAADLTAMVPMLTASPVLNAFLATISTAPIFPRGFGALQAALVRVAVGLLPPAIRARTDLPAAFAPRPGDTWLARRAAAMASALATPSHPAVAACARLGLPADMLFSARR